LLESITATKGYTGRRPSLWLSSLCACRRRRGIGINMGFRECVSTEGESPSVSLIWISLTIRLICTVFFIRKDKVANETKVRERRRKETKRMQLGSVSALSGRDPLSRGRSNGRLGVHLHVNDREKVLKHRASTVFSVAFSYRCFSSSR